jgi:PAB-dependent poly(A)-specific ribonuclease subunit 3
MDSSFYYPSHLNIAVTPAQPLQYHLYAPPLPYITGSNPQQRAMQTFFMADDLREELLKRVEATVRHPDPYCWL